MSPVIIERPHGTPEPSSSGPKLWMFIIAVLVAMMLFVLLAALIFGAFGVSAVRSPGVSPAAVAPAFARPARLATKTAIGQQDGPVYKALGVTTAETLVLRWTDGSQYAAVRPLSLKDNGDGTHTLRYEVWVKLGDGDFGKDEVLVSKYSRTSGEVGMGAAIDLGLLPFYLDWTPPENPQMMVRERVQTPTQGTESTGTASGTNVGLFYFNSADVECDVASRTKRSEINLNKWPTWQAARP